MGITSPASILFDDPRMSDDVGDAAVRVLFPTSLSI